MALNYLQNWSPFRIDALGLVTMIGAEEVDWAIGRLIFNPWTEFLPLLGAFVVAGNRFIQPIPGVVMYNITDGVMATDVAGWVPRWLAKQKLNWNTNTYIFAPQKATPRDKAEIIQALAIGIIFNIGLLVLCVLIADWFGFANTVALIVSIATRWYMLEQNRLFLEKSWDELEGYKGEVVKLFCLLIDGKAVSIEAPRGFVLNSFLTTPRPSHPYLYYLARAFGWVAFGFHVICIGQATLAVQIITVVIMIAATVGTVFCIGCHELHLGRRVNIRRLNTDDLEDRRSVAYARMGLSPPEEETMLAWALVPQRSNSEWWSRYYKLKESMNSSKI
ncbi:hypothetical protein F5B19DRAFT_461891 [Rostrohypoxylon terebratum]|nr:hypothetical protein F5B19DRAFT_461891 [Rostrohypoxylon terebratum]